VSWGQEFLPREHASMSSWGEREHQRDASWAAYCSYSYLPGTLANR